MPVTVYVPEPLPFGMEPTVSEYLERELRRISDALGAVPAVTLGVLAVEPDKPEEGMLVYADGTNWDPGEGEGYYGYINGVWIKMSLGPSDNPSFNMIRLTSTADVSLSSTLHAFQIGADNAANLAMDNNEIQARNNGAAALLGLNVEGGAIFHSGQLEFPAVANPSANANTLDDYEEGTWTPTYTSATGTFTSITYTANSGIYTKIGNLVTLSWRILTSAVTVGTASGQLRIAGMPFANSTATSLSGSLGYMNGWTNKPEKYILSASLILLYKDGGVTNYVVCNVTDMGSTSEIRGTLTYQTP